MANFGDITSSVSIGAGQSVRRNAGDTAFEAYTPSAGAGVPDGDYGDITVSGSGAAWTVDNGAITLAKQADMATGSVVYRKTAGAGAPEVQTLATLKTDLALVKGDVGLGNVDNTSDANKPVSTATQTALDLKVDENAPITGATKTKVTYDAKGLVTAGADATTADIADSANKRYVTDAQLTVIGNTSGTNTGDQTITLTGDVTGTGTGSFATTIANGAVSNTKLANSSITIAGTSTSLGGSITQDTITGLASTGLVKRTAANTLGIATPITDYLPGYTLVATLASDQATGANTTPVTLTNLVFTYAANSKYLIECMALVSPTAATTGCGFQFDLSSAVTSIWVMFDHQLANTGTLSGGHSIADDASVGVSSGMPGTSTYPVRVHGLLITTGNTGTAQLRFRSETTAVTTCKAGTTLIVRKIA